MNRGTARRLTVLALEDRQTPVAGLAAGFGFVADLGSTVLGTGKAIVSNGAGGTIFAGTESSSIDGASSAMNVINYSADGEILWSTKLGEGLNWQLVRGAVTDPAGNVFVAGQFTKSAAFDPAEDAEILSAPSIDVDGSSDRVDVVNTFLVKLNSEGTFQWAKSFGDLGFTAASGIAVDPDGNLIVVGEFQNTADFDPDPAIETTRSSLGDSDGFAAKYTNDGDFLWVKTFAGGDYSGAIDISIDPAGNAFVVGNFNGLLDGTPTPGTGLAGFLTKLDPAGTTLWTRTFGGNGITTVTAVGGDEQGSLYLTGTLSGTADFQPGTGVTLLTSPDQGSSAFLSKFDTDGRFQWAKKIGSTETVGASDVAADAEGASIVGFFSGTQDFNPGTGTYLLTSTNKLDAFTLKVDPNGQFLWSKSAGGDGDDRGEAVTIDDGRVVITGSFDGELQFETPDGVQTLEAVEIPTAFLFQTSGTPDPSRNLSPVVSIDGTFAIVEGEALILHAEAIDREGDPLTATWDLNNDGTFGDVGGLTPRITWSRLQQLGLTDSTIGRTVRLKVDDGRNTPVVVSTTLIIEDTAPRAQLRVNPDVSEGQSTRIQFTNATDPSNADTRVGFRYSFDFDNDGRWDLGDGTSFAGSTGTPFATIPVKYLRESGTKRFQARIFDKDGAYSTYHAFVNVRNVAPTAVLGGDKSINEGQTALVKFTNIVDPGAADTRVGFRFSYDFNNDGIFEIGDGKTYANSVTAPAVRIPAGYFLEGPSLHPVRARIFDQDGGYREYTTTIRVNNLAPTARFAAIVPPSIPLRTGQPIGFVFTGMNDASPADRAAGFRYGFDFNNDGTFEQFQSSPLVNRTWNTPGRYTIRARIADKDGGFTDYMTSIVVVGSPSI